ncbi:uncharacterized protein PHACADRAFT_63017, partial [Phanerochaete carnosa HHB-10118-sp]
MHALRSLRPLALRKYATSAVNRFQVPAANVAFKGISYSLQWLRDSCQCPRCVHPSSRQKLHRTSDIPNDAIADSVRLSDDGIHITWAPGHSTFYSADFLERYAFSYKLHAFHRDVDPLPWDKPRVQSAPDLFLEYQGLSSPSGLLRALTQLTRYGLIFVTGVSPDETSNDKCEARRLAQLFAEIRETFYGEMWDVVNVKNSKNIAYTNLHLGLHMDLLYFQHPPRYQLLHCLRNRVQGGTSVFVDALYAANRLQDTHPPDFDVLTKTLVPFHYINNGNHLHHVHPTIELNHEDYIHTGRKRVQFINYSPPFQAPLPALTPHEFYSALSRFTALLDSPEAAFEYTLREGDAILFDNRRILHARTAFNDLPRSFQNDSEADTTNRWLKGCYLEADKVLNRRRVLEARL